MSVLRRRALSLVASLLAVAACGLDSLTLEGGIPSNPTSLPRSYTVRSVSVADARFVAQVRAPGEAIVSGNSFTIPLGDRAMRCEVSSDPWSLATRLQGQLRKLGQRERIGLVRTSARLGDSGRPYMLGEALYGTASAVKGIAQIGVFGSSEGTVACATEGNARVIEAFAMIENLAESQRWTEEDGREKPLYAETNRVFLGDVPVGFEYRYLRRGAGKGLTWFKVRGLTGRVGDAAITAIDDVTIERLDEQRFVRESRIVLMSDGDRTYDLTVQREPDGALHAAGVLAGKKLGRALPSDRPIASDLSAAALFRELAAGKSSRVVARRLHVEGTELRVADEEFVRGKRGELVGPGGLVYSLDDTGFVHMTEQRDDAEASALRIERTRVHGKIPTL